MMAKIVKGSGAKGIVDYILDKKKQATLIDCQGVLFLSLIHISEPTRRS